MKSPTNYSLTNLMYNHLNMCKRRIDVEMLQLHVNTRNHLTVYKQLIYNSFYIELLEIF